MIGQRPPPTCSKSQRYGLRVPRLAGRARCTRSDERSCRSRARPCGISARISVGESAEDRDALRLDRAPRAGRRRASPARPRRRRSCSRAPPADHCPRAHDPAHVGDEVDHVAGLRVGLVGDLARDRDEEAALDVEHALRRAGRARGVGEEVRMLGVDLERRELARATRQRLVPETSRPAASVPRRRAVATRRRARPTAPRASASSTSARIGTSRPAAQRAVARSSTTFASESCSR